MQPILDFIKQLWQAFVERKCGVEMKKHAKLNNFNASII